MTDNFEFFDEIERYAQQGMDGAEKADFEKKMAENPVLAREFELYQHLTRTIEYAGEKDALRQAIQKTEAKLESEQFFNSKDHLTIMTNQTNAGGRNWMAIAAALVAIAAAVFFFTRSPKVQEDPFAKYFKPETKDLPMILDRLEGLGLADPEKPKSDTLQAALKLYEALQFEQARSALSAYIKVHPTDKLAQHYLGLSLMNQSEYAKAANHLAPLAQDDSFEYKNTAKWYLALCYTRFNDAESRGNTKKLMQQLADDANSGYQKDAKEYIKAFLN